MLRLGTPMFAPSLPGARAVSGGGESGTLEEDEPGCDHSIYRFQVLTVDLNGDQDSGCWRTCSLLMSWCTWYLLYSVQSPATDNRTTLHVPSYAFRIHPEAHNDGIEH